MLLFQVLISVDLLSKVTFDVHLSNWVGFLDLKQTLFMAQVEENLLDSQQQTLYLRKKTNLCQPMGCILSAEGLMGIISMVCVI